MAEDEEEREETEAEDEEEDNSEFKFPLFLHSARGYRLHDLLDAFGVKIVREKDKLRLVKKNKAVKSIDGSEPNSIYASEKRFKDKKQVQLFLNEKMSMREK